MHFPTHSVVQCTSLPLYLPLFISLSTEKQGSSTRAYLAHVSFLFVAIEMLHVLLLFLLIKTKEQGTDLAAPCCSHNHTHLRTHSIYASIQRWWLLQNTYIIQLCQLKITVFFLSKSLRMRHTANVALHPSLFALPTLHSFICSMCDTSIFVYYNAEYLLVFTAGEWWWCCCCMMMDSPRNDRSI